MRTMTATAMKHTGLGISVDAEVAPFSPSGRILACFMVSLLSVIDCLRLFSLSTRHALNQITSASKHGLTSSFGTSESRNRNSVRVVSHSMRPRYSFQDRRFPLCPSLGLENSRRFQV